MRVDATLADSQPYYGTDFISIVDFYMLSYRERQASGRICSSHGRICQTEVMTTTQLSCWVPLQIAPNCMSMCACMYAHSPTELSSAHLWWKTVGGPEIPNVHTHAHGWGCMLSSSAFPHVARYSVLRDDFENRLTNYNLLKFKLTTTTTKMKW